MSGFLKNAKGTLVLFLLVFALFLSGGCGGGSSENSAKGASVYVIGELPDGYTELFASADLVCVPYHKDVFQSGGTLLIAPKEMEKISSGDSVAQTIKENCTSNGSVILMSPASGDAARLVSILGMPDEEALLTELPADTLFFGVELEKDGDSHFFCHQQDSDSFDGEASVVSSGIFAVRSGDLYEVISGDELLGAGKAADVTQAPIKITMTDGSVVSCLGLSDGKIGYAVSEDIVVSYDIETEISSDDTGVSSPNLMTGIVNLKNWLLLGDGDDLDVGEPSTETNASFKSASDKAQFDAKKNLITLAKQYKMTLSNNEFGKSFLVNNYIVACHKFEDESSATGGTDYYYIEQRGILDSSGNYVKKWAGWKYTCRLDGKTYRVFQGEVADNYIKKYEMKNTFNAVPIGLAIERNPSPTASNHDNTTTSTMGWNVGGGMSGGYTSANGGGWNLSGSLSFGYSCSDTETFNTKDVEPSLSGLNNSGTVLNWSYDFTAARQNGRAGKWQRLYDGAVLGHTTFTPTNMWIWSVPTSERTKYESFNVNFIPTAESVITRNSGSISPRIITKTGEGTTLTVNFPKPPLLAIENNNVSFGNAPESKIVRIGSQGAWTAAVTAGSEWLSVTQNGGQLYISVMENQSGAARKGSIKITRNNTADNGSIAVTQLITSLSAQ
ncbi:MAG: BACON domain-containing protein [Cloacibacillus sp.]